MSQGADPGNTSSPSEEETQGNSKDTNLRSSVSDRKTPSLYDPYFEGNRYRDEYHQENEQS